MNALRLAYQYFNEGDFEHAENEILNSINNGECDPELLQLLAITCAKQKRFNDSNKYFEDALRVVPQRADIHGNYANSLWEQGLFLESERHCKASVNLDGNRPEPYNILGNIYLSKHEFLRAEAFFKQALARKADHPHALNNLGIALQRQGRLDEAISAYQNVLKTYPAYADALNHLGIAKMSQGKVEDAYQCFKKLSEFKPDYPSVARHMAMASPVWLEPLEGNSITIRQCSEGDADFLWQCYNSAEFRRRYNRYVALGVDRNSFKIQLRNYKNRHPCLTHSMDWVLIDKYSKKSIGLMSLVDIQEEHGRAEFMVGILLSSDRNKGYGIEATLLAYEYFFNRVGLKKMISYVYDDNKSSQKMVMGVGFIQEGYLRRHIIDRETGEPLDVYINGLTEMDFRASKNIGKLSQRLLGRDIR